MLKIFKKLEIAKNKFAFLASGCSSVASHGGGGGREGGGGGVHRGRLGVGATLGWGGNSAWGVGQ